MNLRARLSERVHIEDIREVLHFIQDDERLREEIYQLIERLSGRTAIIDILSDETARFQIVENRGQRFA